MPVDDPTISQAIRRHEERLARASGLSIEVGELREGE